MLLEPCEGEHVNSQRVREVDRAASEIGDVRSDVCQCYWSALCIRVRRHDDHLQVGVMPRTNAEAPSSRKILAKVLMM